jgi:hypothetical protein
MLNSLYQSFVVEFELNMDFLLTFVYASLILICVREKI